MLSIKDMKRRCIGCSYVRTRFTEMFCRMADEDQVKCQSLNECPIGIPIDWDQGYVRPKDPPKQREPKVLRGMPDHWRKKRK